MKRLGYPEPAGASRGMREEGVALLSSALFVTMLFAITGSVLLVSVGESRAVREMGDYDTAFYLAEGALDAAKWELAESQDPGGDGVGNAAGSSTLGSWTVTATDLGGGTYKLKAIATAGNSTVTLESYVGSSTTTSFPAAAISIVGAIDKSKFRFRPGSNVILDGGDTPALRATDKDFFDQVVKDFGKAVLKGKLPASNLTGAPENKFELGPKKKRVKLPPALKKFIQRNLFSDLRRKARKKEAKRFIEDLEKGKLVPEKLKEKLPKSLYKEYDKWVAAIAANKGEVKLPLHNSPEYADAIKDLSGLYTELIARTEKKILAEADPLRLESAEKLKKKLTKYQAKKKKAAKRVGALEASLKALRRDTLLLATARNRKGTKKVAKLKKEIKVIEKRLAKEKKKLADYTDLVALTKKKLARSTSTFGSKENPAIVYLNDDSTLEKGQTLKGYGTLVVSRELRVKKGAKLEWEGDVIVLGADKKAGGLKIQSGTVDVKGNLVVLGRGKREATLRIEGGGKAAVDGSLFIGTDYKDNQRNRVKVAIQKGSLDVTGLFTLVGRKVVGSFHPKSEVDVTGIFQIGAPEGRGKETLRMNFQGDLEIHKDDEAIQKGLKAIGRMDVKYGVAEVSKLKSTKIVTHAWAVAAK